MKKYITLRALQKVISTKMYTSQATCQSYRGTNSNVITLLKSDLNLLYGILNLIMV